MIHNYAQRQDLHIIFALIENSSASYKKAVFSGQLFKLPSRPILSTKSQIYVQRMGTSTFYLQATSQGGR